MLGHDHNDIAMNKIERTKAYLAANKEDWIISSIDLEMKTL